MPRKSRWRKSREWKDLSFQEQVFLITFWEAIWGLVLWGVIGLLGDWYKYSTLEIPSVLNELWSWFQPSILQYIFAFGFLNHIEDQYLFGIIVAFALWFFGVQLLPIFKSSYFKDVEHRNILLLLWAIGLVQWFIFWFLLEFPPSISNIMPYLEYKIYGTGILFRYKIFLIGWIITYLLAPLALKLPKLASSVGGIIKRKELPETYPVPSIRKKMKFEPPKSSKEPFKPEPALALEEYEYILEIISNMALVMERNPETFSELKEEAIRDYFLGTLSAPPSYEGQATSETFNYKGKTDILIRYEGRNVFIAECKFWRGKKKLIEAIDQLLKYTSWRDTKTAILLFNKNRDFSSVLKKIDPTVKEHPCYMRECTLKSNKLKSETIFCYKFRQLQDVDREIFLTVMAFDIPKIKGEMRG